MQTLTLMIYFVILPSVFLLNDFDVKSKIVESNWYSTILTIFHCNYIHNIDDVEESNQIDDDLVEDKQNEDQNNINFDVTRGPDNEDRGDSSCNKGLKNLDMKNADKNENEDDTSSAIQASTSSQSSSKVMKVIDVEDIDLS